jgi:hypothetical protein
VNSIKEDGMVMGNLHYVRYVMNIFHIFWFIFHMLIFKGNYNFIYREIFGRVQ